MIAYRIKQFYWAIESLFIKDDFKMLNMYLSNLEFSLFMKITKAERQHSIRVCKAAIEYIRSNNIHDIDEYIMCKCALLHDIGKSKVKLNTIYKSIIIIINKITFGKFLKYNKNTRIINYYNHPKIGVELLKGIGQENQDIIDCVRYHHNLDMLKKNKYIEIVYICDNCN
ncbi:HD domain-containing protein [Clostridium saccharoperbutylacetonicum]